MKSILLPPRKFAGILRSNNPLENFWDWVFSQVPINTKKEALDVCSIGLAKDDCQKLHDTCEKKYGRRYAMTWLQYGPREFDDLKPGKLYMEAGYKKPKDPKRDF